MLLHSANQGGGETKLQKSKKLSGKDKKKHPQATDKGPAGAEIILGAEVILGAQHHGQDPALHQVNHGLEPLHPQRHLALLSMQSLGAQWVQQRLHAKKCGIWTHVYLLRHQQLRLGIQLLRLQLLRWVMQTCQLLHPTHLHLQLLHRRSQWRLMGRLYCQRRSTRSCKR